MRGDNDFGTIVKIRNASYYTSKFDDDKQYRASNFGQ